MATSSGAPRIRRSPTCAIALPICGRRIPTTKLPIDTLEGFAAGEGYWRGLGADERRSQLRRLAQLSDELYPSLRLYLFDRKKVFSAPVTIFGPLQASVYVGRFYLVFSERRQVLELTRHFDGLVREADVEAKNTPRFIEAMAVAD